MIIMVGIVQVVERSVTAASDNTKRFPGYSFGGHHYLPPQQLFAQQSLRTRSLWKAEQDWRLALYQSRRKPEIGYPSTSI